MADVPTSSVPQPSVPGETLPLPVGAVCPDCGYDLRGSTSAICSECGRSLDVFRAREPQIPWSHRRTLGWFKAYWLTVAHVLRRPKVFCLEVVRPVSYADAQSFRWVTLLHAYLPVLVCVLVWGVVEVGRGHTIFAGDWWWLGGLLLWVLLMLAALPGLASYFFQWRQQSVEQQNRAIALSYYAWAPLALMPFCSAVLSAAILSSHKWGTRADWALLGGVMLHVACVVLAYPLLAGFARCLAHEDPLRCFLRTLLLLGLSLGLALVLALVPFAAFCIGILIESSSG